MMKLMILVLAFTLFIGFSDAGLISAGDKLDGIFREVERTNLMTTPEMTEIWIAADESKGNKLCLMKFYEKRIDQTTADSIDKPQDEGSLRSVELDLWRRSDDFFETATKECDQMKTIKYRFPQTLNTVKFDECVTPDIPEPTKNSGPYNPNNETAVQIEKAFSTYMSTPFYTVLTKPEGYNVYELCVVGNCRNLLRCFAKNIVLGISILTNDGKAFVHGNLNSPIFSNKSI